MKRTAKSIRWLVVRFICTLAMVLFLWVAENQLKPWHPVAERFQSPISVACATASIASAPGRKLAMMHFSRTGTGPPAGPHAAYHAAVYRLGLLYNGLFYFLMFATVSSRKPKVWEAGIKVSETSDIGQTGNNESDIAPVVEAANEPSSSPVTLSRRKFLKVSTRGAVVSAGAAGGLYSLLLEPNLISTTLHRYPLKDLPQELIGLRIVQLTDLHYGPWSSERFLMRVINKTNALKPDLILVTGDHVVSGDDYVTRVTQLLTRLKARIGVLSTLGNHDWWSGVGRVRDGFKKGDLPLLDNYRMFVLPDKRLVTTAPADGKGLCIAGVGDLWEDQVDFAGALAPVPDQMPRILMAHNPDSAESPFLTKAPLRIDLMLSGHTHGGQVRLPFLGTPIVPSKFGQKYARGFVEGPTCPVYVNRGIGMTVLPIRFGVTPEIAVFDLDRA